MDRDALAHYRILEKLGAGGMGEVFVAEDTRLGRRVALKILTAETAGAPERLERFQQEARAVAALNHPNIVTLYSVEEEDGRPFLTMELVEGDRLDRLIPRSGVSLERFYEIALPLAEALRGPRQRRYPSRPQTGQRHGDAGGPGEDSRLRSGQATPRGFSPGVE